MATKSEKRRTEQEREARKNAHSVLENPSEELILGLENYSAYQSLYINDAAANLCKNLTSELAKVPYRGNGAKKINGALQKRVRAYFEKISSGELDLNSISYLFAEMDEYMDKFISKFRTEIEKVVLQYTTPEHARWIACLETARTMNEYAIMASEQLIARLVKFSPRAIAIKEVVLYDTMPIIDSLCKFAQEAAGMSKVYINLNEIPEVQSSMDKLNEAFFSPNKFHKAVRKAEEACNEVTFL